MEYSSKTLFAIKTLYGVKGGGLQLRFNIFP